MSESVGQIGLDLNVNRRDFDRQMKGINSIAKKAGAALAAAFAVKKLIDFGSACINLGSDLQEVQNVVDVTFPAMRAQVNKFAQSAAASFGLSETMAKKFTGTFGAMAKAFGFSESAAFDMGTALTGLSGDVASFYNISQDEAYTKLKSVFTGETESLKDLGVVMTQTALDAYALANGYGKTTAKMSEAEKVALRYKFVQNQLTAASGDFIRTSDGWANQVKILKLQFDSFKASVGQGLINVLTPAIKAINLLMEKLIGLGKTFNNFTSMFVKKKDVEKTTDELSQMGKTAGNVAESIESIGNAAAASAKKIKGALGGFDELTVLSSNQVSAGDSTGGENGAGGDIDIPPDENVKDLESGFQSLIDKVNELASVIKKGFFDGLGDTSVFQSIQDSFEKIKESILNIFTDSSVLGAAAGFADTLAYNIGKVSGAIVSTGASLADNLVGGIAMYLDQSSTYIKERIISCFDVFGEIAEKSGELSSAFSAIFEVFRGNDAKQITADIIGIFYDGFLGIYDFSVRIVRDVFGALADPIIENKDKIKEAIENVFKPVKEVLGTLHQSVKDTFKKILEVYEQYVKPAFDKIGDGLSSGLSVALDAYNTYVAPMLERMAGKFTEVWQGSIQPVIDKIITFVGKLANVIAILYTTVVQPFINWIIQTLVPVIMPIIETIGKVVMDVFGDITKAIGGIIDMFGGLIDFIAGIFTGDWERCWNGVKGVFEGIWSFLEGIVSAIMDIIGGIVSAGCNLISAIIDVAWKTIIGIITKAVGAIKSLITTMWNMISDIFSNGGEKIRLLIDVAWEAIHSIFERAAENITEVLTAFWDMVRDATSSALESAKEIVLSAWNNIKTVFTTTITAIKEAVKNGFANVKDTINSVLSTVRNIVTNIWNGIKSAISNAISSVYTNIWNVLNNIKSIWYNIWTGMKNTVVDIFNNMWSSIKGVINSIIRGVETMANGIVRGLNKAIQALNRISFSIPKWVPEIGGMSFGFNVPSIPEISIPKLAQGGYVRANAPQLAMIGDNRHQGEVVAPERKLEDMASSAAASVLAAFENATSERMDKIIGIMLQILECVAQGKTMEIDGKVLGKSMQKLNMEYYKTTGKPLFTVP